MKYVWAITEKELLKGNTVNSRSYLYMTNCKDLKFGDKIYANSNGYVQKRITEDYMGRVIKPEKKLNVFELFDLLEKLRELILKETYEGILK